LADPRVSPNLYDPEFDAEQDEPGFCWRRAFLGRQAGLERLGMSLLEIQPGEATFPYHFHFGNEELLIVVEGSPSLRTPDGWRELATGEVVGFPRGEKGAHQVANRSEEPARVLLVSQMVGPDVVVMPDSGRVQARENAPGARDPGLWKVFRSDDAVDFFEGEEPPGKGGGA
jgi:uncharacterized cupin superfamily protein